MMAYVLGTIIAVFGLITLMVFLALSSANRGSVDIQTQTDPSTERRWSKYLGWGVFALAAMYLWWKFILSKISVEWGGLVPEFSLDTVAMIIVLVGLGVWWSKKEDATTQSGTSTQVSKETSPMIKFIIAAILGILALTMYQYQITHMDEVVKSVPKGYLYLPIHGLLFAGAMMGIAMILTSFSWIGDLFVMLAYDLLLPVGMFCNWFMPQLSDPIVPLSYLVFGLITVFFLPFTIKKISWEEYQSCFIFGIIAVFLPQLFL
jgi:hypothetical protein